MENYCYLNGEYCSGFESSNYSVVRFAYKLEGLFTKPRDSIPYGRLIHTLMHELIKFQEYQTAASFVSDIVEFCLVKRINNPEDDLDVFTCSVQRFKEKYSKSSEVDVDKVVDQVLK